MEFVVLYDEKNETVYNFKKNDFVPKEEVNDGCFLPSIGMAYRILKNQYLFLSMPSIEKIKPKGIQVKYMQKMEVEGMQKNHYETSWS
jgi:hypothetical protein